MTSAAFGPCQALNDGMGVKMDLTVLNEQQRQAAEHLNGPLLILAGAGSGKTRTMTYRIANLLDHGVPAWQILALTFTNKAAREMKNRIGALVGEAVAEDMWVGTFHSICVHILRRDIEKIGYQRSFTIYDDDDQLRVIKDWLKQLKIDDKILSARDVRNIISDSKNKLMTPDEWFRASDKAYRDQQIHDVYVRYEQTLRDNNALDFDDLLMKTLQLLMDHPPVLEYYQKRFKYVHVDEYQDTNMAQYEIVRLITAESHQLCVVGDDDQSIYGWRGADIRNILNFEKDYPDCKVIKLEQNYRSTSTILDAANQVIAHNEGRKEKALWTENAQGEKIKLYSAGDEREEAAWISGQIRQMHEHGWPYAEMAVLYRLHAQSRILEEMLVRAGIPYRVYGGTRFYERREIKDILAYLRVIENPSDTVSLKRIINMPRRSIGDTTVSQLETQAMSENVPMFSILSDPPEALSSRARRCVMDFAQMMFGLMGRKDSMPLDEFVQTILDETGLINQLEKEPEEAYQTRRENLMEFVGAAREYIDRAEAEDRSLEAFLENVALITDLDRQEDAPQFVTLMTLHSAKGLEFDAVFMAGMEENVFPSYRAINEDDRLEEERRLAYVGITRARKQLCLTLARQRTIFNQISYNRPSRFISEIPPRLIEDVWALSRQHFGEEPAPLRKPHNREPRNIDFGTPGMGQLNIPGVSKGFVPSQATKLSGSALMKMYQPGDRVMHRKFGEGKVVSVEKAGADARITIDFIAYGSKEFSLAIAPIFKLED